MAEPLLDLVAIAYEAPIETGAFLSSLMHLDVPYTLTVIDNASPNPRVREVIERLLPTPGLCMSAQYVFNDENLGYARAVNQGMSLGAAPYAAILNSDVEFLPSESIRTITDYFHANPQVGVIGPRTVDQHWRITHGGIITDHAGHNQQRGWQQPDGLQYGDTFEANTVSGATYFVRRLMWEQLSDCPDYLKAAPDAQGAFLPTKHFFEETFCSYHARHHGWKVIYMGPVRMVHQWHRSSPPGSQDVATPRAQFLSACFSEGIDVAGEA